MRKYIYIPFILIATLLAGCAGEPEEEEIDIEKNPLKALMKMGKEMAEEAETTGKIMEERRAKGDTLAIPYQELQTYLPATISGYTTKEPNGATMNMSGMSYSSVAIDYTTEDGNYVRVTMVDYLAAYSLYSTSTALWAAGISIDTPEETAKGFKLGDSISGWQVFKKKSGKASVVLGVGHRFLVTVEANNQEDTEFVKQVIKDMDLDKLTSL